MDGAGLRLVSSAEPSVVGMPVDPDVYQAACVEAYQASQVARGFSQLTIDNGAGTAGAVPGLVRASGVGSDV